MHPSALFLLKLLTAHLAGDYLFQSSRLAREKHRPAFLALHLLAHAVLLALVGLTEPSSPRLWLVLLAVLAAHAAIDAATSRRTPRNLRLLSLDQGLHLASLVVAAHVAYRVEPGHALASVGDALGQPGAWLFAAGLLLAVPAGATVVGRWVEPFREALTDESRERQQGLERAGQWIGMLERLIVFIAVIDRVESLIGFVIAAKAVLRLPEAREAHSRSLVEYYLVGSLASLAWALVVAFGVRWMLGAGPG